MHAEAPQNDSGDHRFYNNLFVASGNLHAWTMPALPCFAADNVFTQGSQPSKFDRDALLLPHFDPGVTLTEKPNGWYLTLTEDPAWRTAVVRPPVTTKLLGKALVPGCAFENPDGSPLRLNTDYFGEKRSAKNPFPGPFEKWQRPKSKSKYGLCRSPRLWERGSVSRSNRHSSRHFGIFHRVLPGQVAAGHRPAVGSCYCH